MKHIITYILLGCLVLVQACKRDDKVEPEPLKVQGYYPNSGKGGTLVTIEGSGFGKDRSNVKVTFAGKEAVVINAQSDRLVVQAPEDGSTGTIALTMNTSPAEIGKFTYQALSISGIAPANGPAGSHIRISGEGFSSLEAPAAVSVNGKAANVVSAGDTLLVVEVPEKAGSGPVMVKVDGMESTGQQFLYQEIATAKPLTGGAGTRVVISGEGFAASAGENVVDFNGKKAVVEEATAGRLVVKAPEDLTTGPLSVSINGQKIVGPQFTVVPLPVIKTVSPLSGPAGQEMTISGLHFSDILDENVVTINNIPLPVKSVSANTITLTIPGGTGDGKVKLAVNDQITEGPLFKDQVLGITKMTPDNGLAGSEIRITGTGFSTVPVENIVTFNGVAAPVKSVNAEGTEIVLDAPQGLSTGLVRVSRNGQVAESPIPFRRAGIITIAGGPTLDVISSNSKSIAVDSKGNVYVSQGTCIKKITPAGEVSVFAGHPTEYGQNVNGTGTNARFFNINGLVIDSRDNLFATDYLYVRKITPAAVVTTHLQASMAVGNVTIDRQDNLYVTQSYAGITKIYPGGASEKVVTRNTNDDCRPAVNAAGNIFISTDMYESMIVRFAGTAQTTWFSSYGYLDGPLNIAQISYGPAALHADTEGNLLIMDRYNYAIRKVDFVTGQVSTLMKLTQGFEDGSFGTAKMGTVKDMAVDREGNIYLLDASSNMAVRKVILQ